MSDPQDNAPFASAPEVGNAFEEAARDAPSGPQSGISESAQTEIDANATRDAALDAHEGVWKTTRDSFSNRSEFDLTPEGAASGASMERQLETARTSWQRDNDALRAGFEDQRQSVREDGVTLSGDFELAIGDSILTDPDVSDLLSLPKSGAHMPDFLAHDQHGDLFAVMEDDHDHEHED